MDIECPESVITAISLLEKSGFEAYTVGGCVRDAIMGKAPHDWDMTTSSAPEQTMEVFKGYRTIPTGIKHGTVTVIINREPIEITTMRIDGEYIDCRHPETVQYTDRIKDDLSRRDFTANAMAYNPKFGVVDPYGGESDIKNKLIKCVGDPDKRFNEDALRIIRALRFSSVLDFEIEQSTEESILRNGFLLEKHRKRKDSCRTYKTSAR
jgi:tRNA nucleotidyltransferase (CCA-adding enzyme)